MIFFSIIPLPSFFDFRHDLLVLEMFLLYLPRDVLCYLALFGRMRENCRAILCLTIRPLNMIISGTHTSTRISALPVQRGRVMGAVEKLCYGKRSSYVIELEPQLTDELSVLDCGRVKFNSQGLSVIGRPSAHFSVCRVLSFLQPASVSDARLENTLVLRRRILFQKYVFDTPKTPRSECGDLALSVSPCINKNSRLSRQIPKHKYMPEDKAAR